MENPIKKFFKTHDKFEELEAANDLVAAQKEEIEDLQKILADKSLWAQSLLQELWLEPAETGLLQKFLPYIVLGFQFLILIILIFKR